MSRAPRAIVGRRAPASFRAPPGFSRAAESLAPSPADACAKRLALASDLAPIIRRAWDARPSAADLAIVVAHPEDPIGRQIIEGAPNMGPGPMVGICHRRELATLLADVNPAQSAALAAADGVEPWIVCVAFWGTTAGPSCSFGVRLDGLDAAGAGALH